MLGRYRGQWQAVLLASAMGLHFSGCPMPPPGIDIENPAGVVLERSAGTEYIPGDTVEITIHIGARDGASITAIGLTESLPEGWSFVSTSATESGSAPAIAPVAGAAGDLEFAWISVPAFPYVFQYKVMSPSGASGTAEISGQVTYRQAAGPFTTDPVVSRLYRPNVAGVVLQRIAPQSYIPGKTATIEIRIDVADGGAITALGLAETVPQDWTYVAAAPVSGIAPAIEPQPGKSGTLDFVWIAPPAFPYVFTYTLHVPAEQAGPVMIVGHVEYREGAGPLGSEPIVSTLDRNGR